MEQRVFNDLNFDHRAAITKLRSDKIPNICRRVRVVGKNLSSPSEDKNMPLKDLIKCQITLNMDFIRNAIRAETIFGIASVIAAVFLPTDSL